MRLVVEGK
jgi:hypothetical protein